MAENKKSFILYADIIGIVEKLPDEKAGQLFKIILNYVNDNDPIIEDLLLQIAFEPIKLTLKRDLKKWENYIEKQRENGKRGGRPKNPTDEEKTQKTQPFFLEPKKADSVSVSVSVSDNVSVSEREKENTPPPEKNRFLIEIKELENYLVSQEQWLEVICMQNKIDKGGAVGWIRKFVEKLKSENVKEKTPADAHSHFSNWLKYELPKAQENGTKNKQDNSSGFSRKGYDPNNGIGDGTLMSDTRRPDKQKNGIWYEFKNGEYVVRAIQNPNQRNLP